MNVGIETVAAQFLSWEYLIRIFGIVSFQCNDERVRIRKLSRVSFRVGYSTEYPIHTNISSSK